MKHPGHTYGGFIPAISERGMTPNLLSLKPIPFPRAPLLRSEPANRRNSHSRQDTVFSMSSPDRPATIRYPRPTKQSTPAPSSPWPPAVLPLCACIPAALPLATVMLGSSRSRQAPAAAAWMPRHRLVRLCMGRDLLCCRMARKPLPRGLLGMASHHLTFRTAASGQLHA
jgi:hypothetical protein